MTFAHRFGFPFNQKPQTLNPMKTTPILLVALHVGLTCAQATPPTNLDLLPTGAIQLQGGSADECQIRPGIVDLSTGKWRGMGMTSKIKPDSGTELSTNITLKHEDSPEFDYSLVAKIAGNRVSASGAWKSESSHPGFGRLDFWIPESMASDLTLECNGKEFCRNFKQVTQGTRFPAAASIVARRTSSGEFLFQIDNATNASINLIEGQEAQGLTIRIAPGPTVDCQIGDTPEISWEIDFEKK